MPILPIDIMPTGWHNTNVMINAYLITGNTYLHRREIKALGGKWSPENVGWLVPTTQESAIKSIVEAHSLTMDLVQTDPINLTTPTGERLRSIRQAKMARKAERLDAQAARLYSQAEGKKAAFNIYHGDISFFTQPANPNSTFGRYRKRVCDNWATGMRMESEAHDMQEKALELRNTPARIAGDAERKRQEKREIADKIHKVGDRVNDPIGGMGIITKVNKKTFTIKFDRGFTWNQDKSWFTE